MKKKRTLGLLTVRLLSFCLLAAVAAAGAAGCNYGKMRDDEASQSYNDTFPQMPQRTLPAEGGIFAEKQADLSKLENALPPSAETIALGSERYRFYCGQCHGPRADGNGTVGQSFAPLPADLRSEAVQEQSDGELFYKIRFGFMRHPPLFSTASEEETWAVIRYLRSLVDYS